MGVCVVDVVRLNLKVGCGTEISCSVVELKKALKCFFFLVSYCILEHLCDNVTMELHYRLTMELQYWNKK